MRLHKLAITLLLAMTLPTCVQADDVVIDRIIAIVNGKLILQSDVQQEARMEAFLSAQQPSQFTSSDLQETVQRMIDRQLVHEQMRSIRTVEPNSQAVERRLKQLRDSLGKPVESDAGWQAAIAAAGLTEQEIREHFADEVQTMRFLEARLRPQIQVDAASIETYYREKFLPELEKSGEKPVPLSDVSRKIRDILTEQKLDASLSVWLKSLRAQSEVRTPAPIENDSPEVGPQAQ